MTKFDDLKKVIADAEEHNAKFDGGNHAAGTRLRKSMMEVITLAKGIRQEVSDIKNGE